MMLIMRYPEGHKESVRETIVESASRAFRRHGLQGVSIPALMKEAGLTHGGFYSHFENRDELVAEAIEFAAMRSAGGVMSENLPLADTAEKYLSKGHLLNPENGCVLAALGTDAVRQPPRVRRAFADVALGFLRLMQDKLHGPGSRSETLSDEALARASTMVGAVVLARLVREPALAERILSAARTEVSK